MNFIKANQNSTGQASNVTGKAKVLGPGQLAVAFFPGRK